MRGKSQLFTFVLFVCCLSARADVIFSNITGDVSSGAFPVCAAGYSINPGCPFRGNAGGVDSVAAVFTPSADFTLTDAEVLVSGENINSNTFTLSVNSDVNGIPGSAISGIGTGLIPLNKEFMFPPPSVVTVDFNPVTLTAGTQYFLTMQSFGPTPWFYGGSSSVPTAEISFDATLGTNACATPLKSAQWCPVEPTTLQFQIDGSPALATVPEPSYLSVMAALTLCLFWVKYHRKAS
jgi:hypothetical protein